MRKNVILCVDDEKIVLNSLKSQLREVFAECDIEMVESGYEALEIIDEMLEDGQKIPLIISDYSMPRMKGDEFLKKAHERIPQTVKILLTGQATTEGVTNALNEANLYRYIAKPWEKEDLCMTIREAVQSFHKDRLLEEQKEKLELYNKELIELMDAVVETMVAALDTRDTTTAGHSKRLAGYAVKMAEKVNAADYGLYKDFKFSDEQIKELYYAALLHDIGKIGIKEGILLKQFRLSEEKQKEIEYRLNYHKKCLELKKISIGLHEQENEMLLNLNSYIEFIMDMSKRGYITDEEENKINIIAQIEFSDTDNSIKKLLTPNEVESLCVRKGNLTGPEREIIKSHVIHTYNILSKIPWPKDLSLIPEIALSHHERIDGSGYCYGLKSDKILLQSKILAILDIFEALTAQDRPYKPPLPIEKAINIIKEEVDSGYLDKDLYEIFIKEKVYDLYRNDLQGS